MAEVLNRPTLQTGQLPTTAAQPAALARIAAPAVTESDKLTFMVTEFDAAGAKTQYVIALPQHADFKEWSLIQQVGMLKRGVWKNCSVPDVVWGLSYAKQIGADVMLGELFPTGEGRWGTSNKYKIKRALESGKVVGYEINTVELNTPVDLQGCIQKKELECTVTIEVKGLNKPLVRKAKLSRWFMKGNPNWLTRPEHMLELNTLAHACEYITPGGTEADELPGLDENAQAPVGKSVVEELRAQIPPKVAAPVLNGEVVAHE